MLGKVIVCLGIDQVRVLHLMGGEVEHLSKLSFVLEFTKSEYSTLRGGGKGLGVRYTENSDLSLSYWG